MRFMQDYDLFARLLAGGARMTNLAEPLVLFRAGDTMRRRRSARGYLALELELQRRLRSYGLIGPVPDGPQPRGPLDVPAAPAAGHPHAYARFLSTPVAAEVRRGGGPVKVTGEMVARQARLMGSSVRGARARAVARHASCPGSLATRGRSTMRLRLPWLPFRLIDELAERVDAGRASSSTAAAARRCGSSTGAPRSSPSSTTPGGRPSSRRRITSDRLDAR